MLQFQLFYCKIFAFFEFGVLECKISLLAKLKKVVFKMKNSFHLKFILLDQLIQVETE